MKKILSSYWPYILIFTLSFLVTWPLLKTGYFSHQDDLQIIRIFEMRRCFSDFQIPCRWVSDMGWGNGYPLFNFYGVSLYYLGALLSFLVGYIISAKILFFVSLIAGSIGIYLLVKELWGTYAGVFSGILYMFAPYKALDIYVRGALAESFALALAPFAFYFSFKLITSSKKAGFGTVFSLVLFIFLITHNIMTLIFMPVLAIWMIYWLAFVKWKDLKEVVAFSLFSLGMASFFLIPAFFEKGLVQSDSLTRFELDFRANYLKVYQLFLDRVWGYGTSIPGPEGGMNFQIGWPHWLLAVLTLPFIFLRKMKKEKKILAILTFAVFAFAIFMTHNKSTFIWINISLLKYFQFPWRFLSLAIFAASVLGGFIISEVKGKFRFYLFIILGVLTVVLNWQYFRPKEFFAIDDSQKLSGQMWEEQKRGALLDYLPKTALEPREEAPNKPIVVRGAAEIARFVNKSGSWELNIKVDKESDIEVPVFYFPNWQVYVNGQKYPFNHDNVLGRISFTLEPGEYKVIGKFENTPVRTVGNIITLMSAAGLIGYVAYAKSKKIIK